MAEMVAEHGLAGGAHSQALFQLVAAAGGDPGHLGGKAVDHARPLSFSRLSGISTGIATFSWPVALKRLSRFFWIFSQMA